MIYFEALLAPKIGFLPGQQMTVDLLEEEPEGALASYLS